MKNICGTAKQTPPADFRPRSIILRRLYFRRGFALIELLVALSLLGLVSVMVFSFHQFTQRYVFSRQKSALAFEQSQALLRSASRNIRLSRATLLLAPQQWDFVRADGETCSYSFGDNVLRFDSTVVLRDSSVTISFTGFGQDSLLDPNRDQMLDFKEMDLDADGKLEPPETGRIERIRVTIMPKAKGEDFILLSEEAIRNRM